MGHGSNKGPQLHSQTRHYGSHTGPDSRFGCRTTAQTQDPTSRVRCGTMSQTQDPSPAVGPQIQVWIQEPSSDTGPRLWVWIQHHAWDTGPHLPAQPQTKPLNPAHPAALPRSCTGTQGLWRGLNSNPPSHGPRTHCGEGCSPHKGFLGAGRARGAVTAWRSGSVAGARCRCRILWVIKSPPAPRGEIAALGDSDKAAGEIPSEMQKR